LLHQLGRENKYREFIESSTFTLNYDKLKYGSLAQIRIDHPPIYPITVDKNKLDYFSKKGVRIILLHEIAHAYVRYKYPTIKRSHSTEWRDTFIDFQNIVLGKVHVERRVVEYKTVYTTKGMKIYKERQLKKEENDARKEREEADKHYVNSLFIDLLDRYYKESEDKNRDTNFEDFVDYVVAHGNVLLSSVPQKYKDAVVWRIRSREYLHRVYWGEV